MNPDGIRMGSLRFRVDPDGFRVALLGNPVASLAIRTGSPGVRVDPDAFEVRRGA